MNIYRYNISRTNKLTIELFREAHLLIDNIEEYIFDYIKSKTTEKKYISKDATIHKSSIIGDNVFIGDNVYIGPHCYIKSNTIILNDSSLGFSVETDRCVLFNGVKISHNACIGRCIIGEQSNLPFNFVIATRNIIDNPIKSGFNNEVYISSRKHHGAVIGANLIAGVNVSVMPGTTIEENVYIKNNVTVSGHITAESMIHR